MSTRDPGQCRHGWRADQCPNRYNASAPMGPCGGTSTADSVTAACAGNSSRETKQ